MTLNFLGWGRLLRIHYLINFTNIEGTLPLQCMELDRPGLNSLSVADFDLGWDDLCKPCSLSARTGVL